MLNFQHFRASAGPMLKTSESYSVGNFWQLLRCDETWSAKIVFPQVSTLLCFLVYLIMKHLGMLFLPNLLVVKMHFNWLYRCFYAGRRANNSLLVCNYCLNDISNVTWISQVKMNVWCFCLCLGFHSWCIDKV